MTSSRHALSLWLTLMLLGRAAPATDAVVPTERPATLSVQGTCPDGEAIWTDVKTIVPVGDLSRVTIAKIDVTDLGESYRVRIVWPEGERLRVFRDLDRDCDHRARFAAVFVVLTLLPPDVLLDIRRDVAPPPVAPSPVAAVGPPLPVPPPRRHLRLDLSATVDVAPPISGGPSATAFGGAVRFSWGSRTITPTLGAGLEPHTSFRVGGLGVEEFRAPFDVGASLVTGLNRATLTAELGLAGVLFRVSGADTLQAQSGARLDLGARAGVALRVGRPSAELAPVVGLQALALPKPYELTAIPQGALGKLPALWIGATAGISFAR